MYLKHNLTVYLSQRIHEHKVVLCEVATYIHNHSRMYAFNVSDPNVEIAYRQCFGTNSISMLHQDFNLPDIPEQQPLHVSMLEWLRESYDHNVDAFNAASASNYSTWEELTWCVTVRDAIQRCASVDLRELGRRVKELHRLETVDVDAVYTSISFRSRLQAEQSWVRSSFPEWLPLEHNVVSECLALVNTVGGIENEVLTVAQNLCRNIREKLVSVRSWLKVIKIPGDGNCFFTALGMALGMSSTQIRLDLSNALLKLRPEADGTPGWQIYYNCLPPEDKLGVKKLTSLSEVKTLVLQPKHWATDFDIRICSGLYNVFIILLRTEEHTFAPLGFTHVPRTAPFVLMQFDSNHFNIVSSSAGHMVFSFAMLPVYIKTKWIQTCGELDFKAVQDPLFLDG